MAKAILLTGRPGCGKTTLIRRVVEQLAVPAGGFYTREIRKERKRLGFELVTLDGQQGMLAHVGRPGRPRIGKYGVDLSALEGIGVAAVEEALATGKLVVVDEIGPMELLSARVRKAILRVLDGDYRMLATIALRDSAFTRRIKGRADVTLIEVRPDNRNELSSQIVDMIQAWSSAGR